MSNNTTSNILGSNTVDGNDVVITIPEVIDFTERAKCNCPDESHHSTKFYTPIVSESTKQVNKRLDVYMENIMLFDRTISANFISGKTLSECQGCKGIHSIHEMFCQSYLKKEKEIAWKYKLQFQDLFVKELASYKISSFMKKWYRDKLANDSDWETNTGIICEICGDDYEFMEDQYNFNNNCCNCCLLRTTSSHIYLGHVSQIENIPYDDNYYEFIIGPKSESTITIPKPKSEEDLLKLWEQKNAIKVE